MCLSLRSVHCRPEIHTDQQHTQQGGTSPGRPPHIGVVGWTAKTKDSHLGQRFIDPHFHDSVQMFRLMWRGGGPV